MKNSKKWLQRYKTLLSRNNESEIRDSPRFPASPCLVTRRGEVAFSTPRRARVDFVARRVTRIYLACYFWWIEPIKKKVKRFREHFEAGNVNDEYDEEYDDELNKYLKQRIDINSIKDTPLMFSYENRFIDLILSHLARSIFSMPATTRGGTLALL